MHACVVFVGGGGGGGGGEAAQRLVLLKMEVIVCVCESTRAFV